MKPKFIEFNRDTSKPFSVYMDGSQFDVEYCNRDDQFYIDESSTGAPYLEHRSNLWWSDGLRPDAIDEQGKRFPAPLANRIDLPEQYLDEEGDVAEVERWAIYDRCEYCDICEDCLPTDDLCEHIEWNDEQGEFVKVRAT